MTTLAGHLYSPFFDLEPRDGAPLLAAVPLLAYDLLDSPGVLVSDKAVSETLRMSLVRQSGRAHAAAFSPLEVPETERSERWARVCDLVERFPALDPIEKGALLRVLLSLGFYRIVLRLVPNERRDTLGIHESVDWIAALRAFARYALHLDDFSRYSPYDLEEILASVPDSSPVAFWVASTLMVYRAKFHGDVAGARTYHALAERRIAAAEARSSFEDHIRLSRFYRGASFLPFLTGDRGDCLHQIQLSFELADNAPARTQREQMLARDAQGTALESQMRVWLWLGDLDRALALAEQVLGLDSCDARTHSEIGEIRLRRGEIAAAAEAFERAARLGPPGTAVSYFMAGWCRERLGDQEVALSHHLSALRFDPLGISPLLRAVELARALADRAVLAWAEARVRELAARGMDLGVAT